jgi:tetratricopeptide (TPR) repeat protein
MRVFVAGVLVLCCAGIVRGDDVLDFGKLWDWDHPDKSEAAFRELLPKASTESEKVEILTQVARAQGLQRKFEEAHKTLDGVEKMLGADGIKARARIRYLLERGRVFNSSKQQDKAKAPFTEAWELGQKSGEENLAVDAAHMMGIAETGDASLAWNEKAIAYAEQARDPKCKGWLGPLYNNTGWTYYDKKDYPKALEILTKAQTWFEQKGNPSQIRIAKYSVGKVLRALGKVTEALAIQEKLLAELEKINEKDGYFHEEAAECLLLLKRDAEARKQFASAYELLSKDEWLVANEPERVKRLKAEAEKK